MSFLSAFWLFGLTSLLAPIVLHLQRQRTKTMDWAAMRFLQKSLTKRRRGLTLEQYLLLLCRCLLLTTFVAAMARPWTTGRSFLGDFSLFAVIAVGLGIVAWGVVASSSIFRRSCLIAGGLSLLILSGVWTFFQDPSSQRGSEEPCDAVLIIDASDSMGLNSEDSAAVHENHLAAALAAAEQFLEKLPADSTATVLFGGSRESSNGRRLDANLQAVREQLKAVSSSGGSCYLPHLIETAKLILQRGQNARKQIVLFSDDQWTNWQSLSEHFAIEPASKQNDEHAASESDVIPMFGRVFSLPDPRHNLAVNKLEIAENTWRIGDRFSAEIEVFNGGTQASTAAMLEIRLNDVLLESRPIDSLAPGLRQTVPIEFLCEHAGAHVLSARIDYHDDIPNDNRIDRAFAVQAAIPVLIINGDVLNSPSRRSAHYIRLALSSRLTALEIIDVRDLTSSFDFSPFQTVVLCDVPSMPTEIANSIAKHVTNGAGLFVLLGPNCESRFYENWQWEDANVFPTELGESPGRVANSDNDWRVDVSSVQHPALDHWLKSGEHDLLDWRANRVWDLSIPLNDPDAPWQVALRFTDGHPFLLERTLGLGRVLVQTSLPDLRENNFINRVSFPVWMHLLTRHLADQLSIRLHQSPNSTWVVELPRTPSRINDEAPRDQDTVSLTLRCPQGVERPVAATAKQQSWIVDLGDGHAPGRYQLIGELRTALGSGPWSLTIERDGREADLSVTTERQLKAIADQIGLQLLTDDVRLVQTATGEPLMIKWWRTLANFALGMLVLESVLLRWVAWNRGESNSRGSILAMFVRPLNWVFLIGVWLVTWLSWTSIWDVLRVLASATFNQSLFWQGISVATLSCLIVSTYWDGRLHSILFSLTPMKLARLLLVGLVGFVLLEPVQTRDEESIESRRVVVLWDRSGSMQLPEADTTRESIARQVLWQDSNGQPPLLPEMERDYTVDVFEFAANARSMRTVTADGPKGSDQTNGRWAETTDLSTALQRVIADVPIAELSGVVLVTDGRDRSIDPPLRHAAVFAKHQVPIHSIVIGSQAPLRDAEVVTLQVPGHVFAEDTVTIRASLKFDQLRGHTANVRILRDGELLKTTAVPITVDQFQTTLAIEDLPREVGLHRYTVAVDPMDGERIEANNQQVSSVWVTKDRLRLLIVEQRPRWEFRYLKNLFAGRDQNVALQHVLLSPDRLAGVPDPFPMPASAARAFDDCEANQLPESEQEWLKFDVIVLGDIDPSELDIATQRTLQKFVGKRGGTLIVVAGQQAMPHRYLDGPLGELLPAQLAQGATKSTKSGYRLRLTEDGNRGVLMQAPFAEGNQPGMWDTLPTLFWRSPVAMAKPGATVLAWAEEDNQPSELEAARHQALVLWHRYGGGRVLQLNFDQTWRLRFWNGDEHHHRFWGRVMRWGTEDRLGMGTDLVRMGTDKSQYKIGDQMNVKVRLVDDQPVEERDLRLILLRDDQPINEYPLHEVADSGGLLQSRLTLPDTPGRYQLQVVGQTIKRLLKTENRVEDAVFADFAIDGSLSNSEANDIVASTAVVGPLAQRTGGFVLVPETASQVLEKLGPKSTYRRDVTITPIWNLWPIVTLFFTLLIGEWMMRRWRGLI